jgi:hypothetical protein
MQHCGSGQGEDKMRYILVAAVAMVGLLVSQPAFSDTYVRGYTKKDGTTVDPYYRSDSNNSKNDNFSTRGNVNPYTGKVGTRNPDDTYRSRTSEPSKSNLGMSPNRKRFGE